MSGWDFRVPSWPEIEWRLSHWGDAVHTSIAGGLDRVGAAAQMPWRRIRCLRMAMWEGQSIARGNLLHRFADLDIQQILPGLLDAAKDMVMILAGAMATGGVLGGVVGGTVGAFGAGAGAIPGALAGAAGGAAIGLEVGNWILVLLGLGAIGEFVLASLPRLIDKYKRGIAIAWSGPQSPAGPYPDRHAHDREQDAIHAAAKEFAVADEALVILLLAGMAAYLWHRGGKAVNGLVQEANAGRLGEKFGDWLTRNAEKLKAREDLGGPQRGGVSRGEQPLEGKQTGRGDEPVLHADDADATSTTAGGTADSVNGARLAMQLSAEQAAGVRAPVSITGYSDHALAQIASRDGGIGVNQAAVNDAFINPVAIQYVPSKYGPTFKYIGQNATVIVNPQGHVVTTWGTSAAGVGK